MLQFLWSGLTSLLKVRMTGKANGYSEENSGEVMRRTCCRPGKMCHASTWEQLFDALPDPVLVVRPDGTIIEANEAAIRATGKEREDILGQGICQIVHGGKWPHIKCPLEEFLKTCAAKEETSRLPGFSGEFSVSILPVKKDNGEIDRIMFYARPLTKDEIQKVDSIRTAKLAGIGELAAGVAHEVNNPITGVINFAQILLDNHKLNETGVAIVKKIMKEGERIASITRNLLFFAKAESNAHIPVNPIRVVEDSLTLMLHQLRKDGITVQTDFSEEVLSVVADYTQLQQVILNLISNSRYALNARYDGFDEKKIIALRCHPEVEDGLRKILIQVKDFGTGLPQSILERLFEPFFTTKPPGEGTGLGLSISYGIIKDHGGTMRVNSILDKYTEMTIELPAGS